MTARTITREELFKLAWEKPMTELAKEFGVSDVTLAQICKKMGVPKPGLGYWAKVRHGQTPKRPTLPPQGKYKADWKVSPTLPHSFPQSEELTLLETRETAPENRIHVPASLDNPHPWIARAQKEFQRQSKKTGYIGLGVAKHLNIHVTQGQADRALRIFDTLLKALAQRGVKVWLDKFKTFILFDGEELQVELREPSSRRHLTQAEKDRMKKEDPYCYFPPNLVDTPNGKLQFVIRNEGEFYKDEARIVKDIQSAPLEERLNDIIIALARTALSVKLRREERLEREKRWEVERIESEKRRQVEYKEQQWMKKFIEWSDHWSEARRLASFLDEFNAYIREFPPEHEAWNIARVAEKKINSLDPFLNGAVKEPYRHSYSYFPWLKK